MARPHPASASTHRAPVASAAASSPALLHAAWLTAVVAVCLALCTIHSRKPTTSSSSSRRRGGSRSAPRRCVSRDSNGGGAAGAAMPAKVSPTPSDTAKANNGGVQPHAARGADGAGGGPVTIIDVGTHGPIAPAFLLPAPDPLPPRRSLSAKHIRLAERIGRIRSMRRGSGEPAAAAAEDGVFVEYRRGGEEAPEDGTLWTKTIILGERCRVPTGDDGGGGGDVMVPWKSYRPRQPRSVPVTRSNSFAGVGTHGARRPAGNPRF